MQKAGVRGVSWKECLSPPVSKRRRILGGAAEAVQSLITAGGRKHSLRWWGVPQGNQIQKHMKKAGKAAEKEGPDRSMPRPPGLKVPVVARALQSSSADPGSYRRDRWEEEEIHVSQPGQAGRGSAVRVCACLSCTRQAELAS